MDRHVAIALIGVALTTACGGGPASSPAPTTGAQASTAVAVTTPTPAPKLWRPVSAPTNAPGGTEWVAIDSFDGTSLISAVVRPAAATPSAAIVVLPYWGGPRQAHLDVAQWLAGEGYVAFVVCWFPYTDADAAALHFPVAIGCSRDAPARKSASDIGKDIAAVTEAARTFISSTSGRIGVMGDGEGATAAILAASLDAKRDAVVAISGLYGCGRIKDLWGTCLPEQRSGPRAPVLLVHGTNDAQAVGLGGRIAAAQAYEKQAKGFGASVETLYVDGGTNDLVFDAAYWNATTKGKITQFLRSRL
jgi:dienelactone hydrolase